MEPAENQPLHLPEADLQAAITTYWDRRGDEYDKHWLSQLYSTEAKPAWSAALREALPPAVRSFDPFVATVEGAGFIEVRVTRLQEIERLEREMARAPDADIQPQYLISAVRPSGGLDGIGGGAQS